MMIVYHSLHVYILYGTTTSRCSVIVRLFVYLNARVDSSAILYSAVLLHCCKNKKNKIILFDLNLVLQFTVRKIINYIHMIE